MSIFEGIKCVAFDCFGTVFDMSTISREEIAAYVHHVNKLEFTPFDFPQSWYELKAHPDAKEGVELLRAKGIYCVTLSNGTWNLLTTVSNDNGIKWDYVIDLIGHKVYKPHYDAYRTIEKDTKFTPSETLMVTANPGFGDVEGSTVIGMQSEIIRTDRSKFKTIIDLANAF